MLEEIIFAFLVKVIGDSIFVFCDSYVLVLRLYFFGFSVRVLLPKKRPLDSFLGEKLAVKDVLQGRSLCRIQHKNFFYQRFCGVRDGTIIREGIVIGFYSFVSLPHFLGLERGLELEKKGYLSYE